MSQSEIEQVRAAITALEAQRDALGDEVVETALAPLREKLAGLTQPAETPDERKRITILFADVSGYTAMSESLDPEDVTTIMNRLFDALTQEINHYGGTIDKFSGDAVMALFGAPEALENHEEMAVRTALGMQTALAEFNTQLQRERGITLRLRIGLHTGEVLAGWVGGGAARSYTVMGDAVNLASRLEHACPVGRVMISADTARSLHPIFDLEPPRQVTVKGKSEPVTVYVVIGEKARRGRIRGVAGLTAPMVGRDEEMTALRNAFKRGMTEKPWQAATVVGEAGIGKTRLTREFVGWAIDAQPDMRLLSARNYTHTQATPYYLVSRLMRSLFDMGDDVDETTIGRLGDALYSLEPELDQIEHRYQLGSLAGTLGLSLDDNPLDGLDPEQRRDRTFLSLERILLRASEQMPLLIVLDDLHWADAMSVAFLQRLLQTIARDPSHDHSTRSAMLLILSRPAERKYASFAAVLDAMREEPHVSLELERLDIDQSGALVSALLDQELPAELLHLVVDHARGNPFFVEEILRSLIENDVLVEDDGWRAPHSVADINVPDTIQDVLAARLDRLRFEEKQILQYAAVIGRTFWQRLLTEVYTMDTAGSDASVSGMASSLADLEQRRFVARLSESQLVDDWEWTFEHVLIQEVAYSGLLKKVRRRVHREVASQLETRLRDRTGFLIPLIAYHYERGDVPAKAVMYLRKAGDRAAEQYANEGAVEYYTRALTLLDDAGVDDEETLELRYALLLGREGVYGLMGRREEQLADLATLETLAETLNSTQSQAEVNLRYATYYEAMSQYDAALQAASAGVERAEAAGNIYQRIRGLIAWGRALWRQGRLDSATTYLQKALSLATQHQNQPAEANALHHLGAVTFYSNDYETARAYWERALALRQSIGDRRGEAATLSNLVAAYHSVGDLAKGQEYCKQALAVVRSIGSRRTEAYTLLNLGNSYQALGNLTMARAHHERALYLFRQLGDRSGEAGAAENLGLALYESGRYEEARDYCELALNIEEKLGDNQHMGYSATYLALTLERLGEFSRAERMYAKALQIRREIGQDGHAIDDVAGLARLALARGDAETALSQIRQVLEWIDTHGVDEIEYPIRVFLTVADVWTALEDYQKARDAIACAHEHLVEQAERISDDDMRDSFLKDPPLHRELHKRLSGPSP